MEFFRYGFLGAGMHDFIYLCYAFVFSIVVFIGGIILFNLRDGKVMDII
jgi:ABC-type polysaccharide/polyol phosphate export permease